MCNLIIQIELQVLTEFISVQLQGLVTFDIIWKWGQILKRQAESFFFAGSNHKQEYLFIIFWWEYVKRI